MFDPLIADQQARNTIKEHLHCSLFVEAGAGSGKTSSLVARVNALVASGQAKLQEIAIVTFTRKAAGELRERIQLELEQSCQVARGDSKVYLHDALEDLNYCFIGTIHSFCARLLRERPIEAGLSPDFREIEGAEEQLLETRAWNEYLRLADSQARIGLQQVGLIPSQLFSAYQRLNLYPEVEFPVSYTPYPSLEETRIKLDELLIQAAASLPGREPEKGWDALQIKLRRALRWQRSFNLKDDLILLGLLEKLEGSAGITQNRWPSKEIALDIKAAFDQFQVTVLAPALDSWRKYCYKPVMDFIGPACNYYQELRRQENCLNFQDLLLRSAELLRDNEEVRSYYQRRYRYLLIDEFQDTDPLQAELMMYLSADDVREKYWTRVRPRPGSLFVVGDPKQSIYRFRRADIDIFYQVQKQIKEAGGEVLRLTRNFRSQSQIVDWVNEAFSSLLAGAQPPCQAPYSHMVAEKTACPETMQGLTLINLDKEPMHSAEKIAGQDAKRIAAFISHALSEDKKLAFAKGMRSVKPGDFMILVQLKKHMALYARELESLGIPYTISGQNQIGNCAPIKELLYLVQAVADPGNPVLLVAVLRGLFYGFSDQELYDWQLAGGGFCYLDPLPEDISAPLAERFKCAFEQLNSFRQAAQQSSPIVTLEMIANEIGLLPLLTAQGGASDTANYYLLLECLRQSECNGAQRFDQLVQMMSQFLEAGVEEEIDLTFGQINGVRIMNLHKAKGLEAPIVILADPGSRSAGSADIYIQRSGCSSVGWMEICQRVGDYGSKVVAYPPQWVEYCQCEEEYQQAEQLRLLYVAATRAKDMLVISNYVEKPEKSPWAPLLPFLSSADIAGDNPAISMVTPDSGHAEITWEEYIIEQQQRQQCFSRAAVNSSQVATVTGMKETAIKNHSGTGRGRGPAWGNAVHEALEKLADQPELITDHGWLRGILIQKEWPAEDLPVFLQLLTGVMKMDFWQRIQQAEAVLTEVPFGIWEGNCYFKGTIDLIIREGQGWVIVDYKSDVIAGEEALLCLTEHYRPQVEMYTHYWQQITGEKVHERGILFTDVLHWVEIPILRHN